MVMTARTQTLVQLDVDLVAGLDGIAKRDDTSRSAVIRRALREYLRSELERAADERLVEAYRRNPPPEPTEWDYAAARAMIAEEPW
jgi:predicted transcriptional regulator